MATCQPAREGRGGTRDMHAPPLAYGFAVQQTSFFQPVNIFTPIPPVKYNPSMDYSDLIQLIDRAKALHELTKDNFLPSAISLLTPYMSAEDPDNIELVGQARYAANCIEAMWDARNTLFGV
jgi:hypothetical protein